MTVSRNDLFFHCLWLLSTQPDAHARQEPCRVASSFLLATFFRSFLNRFPLRSKISAGKIERNASRRPGAPKRRPVRLEAAEGSKSKKTLEGGRT
jgi:hypothetical protein